MPAFPFKNNGGILSARPEQAVLLNAAGIRQEKCINLIMLLRTIVDELIPVPDSGRKEAP